MAVAAASAPRQEEGSGHRQQSVPLLHKQSKLGSVFSKQTQCSLTPHARQKSHDHKCSLINNNNNSYNQHCRYMTENKSQSRESLEFTQLPKAGALTPNSCQNFNNSVLTYSLVS